MFGIFVAVISGVLIFVLGQIAIRFLIEPFQEFARIRGEVAFALTYYIGGVGLEREANGDVELRRLASQLRAIRYTIPFYSFWARIFRLPSAADIVEASSGVIGMSNSIVSGRTMEEQKSKVRKFLRVD